MCRCTGLTSPSDAKVCTPNIISDCCLYTTYSGVGPEEHLRHKGVRPLHNLPAVGNHLVQCFQMNPHVDADIGMQKDHIGVPLTFKVPITDSLHELEVSPLKAVIELVKYVFTGRGMFSLPFQASCTLVPSRLLDEHGTFMSRDAHELDGSIPENRPDIELMHLTSNSIDYDIPDTGLFTLLVAHIRPMSSGSVRLVTSNPRERPEVDLGFFSHAHDYVALRKGLRLGMRVAADVQKQGYPLQDLIVPDGKSDEDLDRFIRANARTSLSLHVYMPYGPASSRRATERRRCRAARSRSGWAPRV